MLHSTYLPNDRNKARGLPALEKKRTGIFPVALIDVLSSIHYPV